MRTAQCNTETWKPNSFDENKAAADPVALAEMLVEPVSRIETPSIAPVVISMVASVTMKEGRRVQVTRSPFTRPMLPHTRNASAIPIQGDSS